VSTFYLIRHAETDAPPSVLSGRAANVHLSEWGRQQARAVAWQLIRQPVQHVVSSPLARARETAEFLAQAKGLSIETSEAFNEVDFGEWTNATFPELEGDSRWQAYNTFRSVAEIPRGETMAIVQQRFVDGLRRLAAHFIDSHVAIFSHREPILAAVLHFIGLPLDAWKLFEINLAGVTTVVLDSHGVKLVTLNDVSAVSALRVAPTAEINAKRVDSTPPWRRAATFPPLTRRA
jgi:broad specificity phosphatase PhoE